MTKIQEELVHDLRVRLFRNNYPPVFVVSLETLEAAEEALTEWMIKEGLPVVLKCGEHGLWFKGCQLVLEVKNG